MGAENLRYSVCPHGFSMASRSGPSYGDLANAFRQGHFQPLYFFYGGEGFLMDELQALLIEHSLQPHERDFNLEIIHGPEATTPDVLSICSALPMMAERRVVIVRNFELMDEKDSKRKAPFAEYAARPNPAAVVLLLCNGKVNVGHNPYRAFKKHAVCSEFKTMYDNKLPGWITQRFKGSGFEAQGAASQMIAEAVGPDLRTTSNEIDKLISYVGDRKTITEDDVVHAAGHSREHNVFELQKAIGRGSYERSVSITDTLLTGASNRAGEALMIVAILASYFTKLWKLTSCLDKRMPESEMAGHIGVPPFALSDYLRALRVYRSSSIHRALGALLAADMELKGGSERDERLILTLALGRMCVRKSSFA